jgi:CDGSH-type Zn-finger protein
MAEPKIAARRPQVLELAAGTYWWCACGGSQNQPFCDGSHKGTDFRPVQVVLPQEERIALCQCKRTADRPFCDGSHKRLPESD